MSDKLELGCLSLAAQIQAACFWSLSAGTYPHQLERVARCEHSMYLRIPLILFLLKTPCASENAQAHGNTTLVRRAQSFYTQRYLGFNVGFVLSIFAQKGVFIKIMQCHSIVKRNAFGYWVRKRKWQAF